MAIPMALDFARTRIGNCDECCKLKDGDLKRLKLALCAITSGGRLAEAFSLKLAAFVIVTGAR